MDKHKTDPLPPEWSYPVDEEKAGVEIKDLTISPSEDEKDALCQRLNLLGLDKLEARLQLSRMPGGMVVEVQGDLEAEVTQACVVTLDPVTSTVQEHFKAWYADPEKAVSLARARRDRESDKNAEVPMIEEHDDPEPVVDGKIDLGELVTQYLSLSLDPYPHAEGVTRPQEEDKAHVLEEPAGVRKNPFAALKDWKAKLAVLKDE